MHLYSWVIWHELGKIWLLKSKWYNKYALEKIASWTISKPPPDGRFQMLNNFKRKFRRLFSVWDDLSARDTMLKVSTGGYNLCYEPCRQYTGMEHRPNLVNPASKGVVGSSRASSCHGCTTSGCRMGVVRCQHEWLCSAMQKYLRSLDFQKGKKYWAPENQASEAVCSNIKVSPVFITL